MRAFILTIKYQRFGKGRRGQFVPAGLDQTVMVIRVEAAAKEYQHT